MAVSSSRLTTGELETVLRLWRAGNNTQAIASQLGRHEADIERLLHVALDLEKQEKNG
jgi:IS30 family transposase